MKTYILIILSFVITTQAFSQNLEAIYKRHAGEGNYTVVAINGALFQLAASLSDDAEADVAKGIEGIRILSADQTKDKAVQASLIKDVFAFFGTTEYQEFMTVDDGKEKVVFYLKKVGNSITEFALVVVEDVTVIRISGDLDLAKMAKLSKTINIKGMENLEKIDNK